ncbi:hypothetical protein HanXRQr2_Chr16g0732731 [Helianthus annuus]|uniref:Uncharacterized protein n=1 Tax=Helianthus annuus TaxID=4232 RepID=A0A9K3DRD3_HELAN|nr:hypothetical protein HanXRQr2_Chr16g0732731 [Helianthus annuus]KAJ0820006.1 hypothetical protein HanPSC8_Chr16g0702711 [Helianthus annuus]
MDKPEDRVIRRNSRKCVADPLCERGSISFAFVFPLLNSNNSLCLFHIIRCICPCGY